MSTIKAILSPQQKYNVNVSSRTQYALKYDNKDYIIQYNYPIYSVQQNNPDTIYSFSYTMAYRPLGLSEWILARGWRNSKGEWQADGIFNDGKV